MKNFQIILKNNSGFKWYSNQNVYVKGFLFDKENRYFEKDNLLKYFKDIKTYKDFYKFVTAANGSFTIIIKNENKIFIAVDKIRTFPLFYSFKNEQLIISDLSSTFQDLDKDIKLDKSSIAEFKASGFVSDKYTLLKDIFQIRAGEIVTIDQEKIESNIYYNYSISEPAHLSYIENQKKLVKLFDESFNRLIKSLNKRTVIIPLSGGYDSRLIAVLLKNLGYENVVCYTYGRKENPEVNISKTVAERLNYKWYFIEYTEDLLSGLLNDDVFIKYCPFNTNHHTMIFLQEYFAVKYLKENSLIPEDAIFLPGHSGDFLAGSQLVKNRIPDKNIGPSNLVNNILKKKYSIIRPNTKGKKLIKKRIKQSLISHNLHQDNLLSYSLFEDWDFKEKLAKVIFNSSNVYSFFGYEYRFPFWDDELVNFFKNLPFDQKIYKKLYDETIKNSYFLKHNLNFQTEMQPGSRDFKFKKIKDLIKKYLPGTLRKKLLLRNDIFSTEFIIKQLIYDLKRYGYKTIWGTSINSIQIQWYLKKVKLHSHYKK